MDQKKLMKSVSQGGQVSPTGQGSHDIVDAS